MSKTNNIKTIILAAGKGTRMKSSTPKVLHKVFSKTLLERVINSVIKANAADEIFCIVGHQAETVSDFVENTYQNSNITSILQQPQLGTGDAVFKAYDRLKGFKGNILVLCGDTPLLTAETIEKFITYHNESKSVLTVMSAKFDNPKGYGRIIRTENGDVSGIIEEKDATSEQKLINEVNAGVYCFDWEKVSPAFFELTTNNEQGEYYLTDIVSWSVKNNFKVQGYILEDNKEMFGVNSKADLAAATTILKDKTNNYLMTEGVTLIDPASTWISPETTIGRDTVIYPGCYIDGENNIAEDCEIGPNSYFCGNVKIEKNVKIIQSKISDSSIGENSQIGPFAHLRQNVNVANDVRIGNFVEVKNSNISNNTNAAHLAYVGDAEVGQQVNIGAGTITANYDPITKIKSKTIIEDGVKIGSNSVLIAPVKLGKKSAVAAGSVITKEVSEGSLAIGRSPQKAVEGWVEKKICTVQKNEII
ncbi:MAG: bifunctional UDP-N-acetylglucosamine diphosphorylase/glucosamine-1-phosphate N-acetyltransferase GlmU [bacterium]